MLDRVVAACFKDVEEADQVAVDVRARVLDGIAYSRLGSEVDNDCRLALLEDGADDVLIGKIGANENEAAAFKAFESISSGFISGGFRDHLQAIDLDAGIVVVVAIVVSDHCVVGGFQEALAEECADEACGSGSENGFAHACIFFKWSAIRTIA